MHLSIPILLLNELIIIKVEPAFQTGHVTTIIIKDGALPLPFGYLKCNKREKIFLKFN